MNKMIRISIPFCAALLGLAGLFIALSAASAQAEPVTITDIVVDTLDDELNTDGDCSLREAITAVNDNIPVDACPAGDAVITDTIAFEVAGTITVTSQLSVTAGGPLVIDGGDVITTSGGGTTRVWWVETGSVLTLQHLGVVDGYVNDENGAGLYNNAGSVTIAQCEFIDNHLFESSGGGIYSLNGTIIIMDSFFMSNGSENQWSEGGGIYIDGGVGEIIHTSFQDNDAQGFYPFPGGGGIYVSQASVTIQESSFISNTGGGGGGGIFNFSGTVIVTNSTLSENHARSGGAIRNRGTTTVTNSTLRGNSADNGGGIYGRAILTNTIVADSPSGGDCNSAITDSGHNISSDDTCGFDPANGSLPDTDPLLGPLQDNGGSTWMHALLAGSPAIDAGDDAACPATDQRGVARPLDGNGDGQVICDIGSFEFEQGIGLQPLYQSGSGVQGATVEYTLELYNFTNLADTYSLALGAQAWDTALSTEMIGPLTPGTYQFFTASVTIPVDAARYLTDTVVVTATSVTSPTVYFGIARVTTTAVWWKTCLPVMVHELEGGP